MCELTRCCCFGLRQGSLIIAYLQLVSAGLFFVANALVFAKRYESLTESKDTLTDDQIFWISLHVTLIAVSGTIIAVCSCLVYGIKKERPSYMLPWLCLSASGFIGEVFLYFHLLFMLFQDPKNLILLLLHGIRTVLLVYLYSCVLSYYKELRGKPQMQLTSPPGSVETRGI